MNLSHADSALDIVYCHSLLRDWMLENTGVTQCAGFLSWGLVSRTFDTPEDVVGWEECESCQHHMEGSLSGRDESELGIDGGWGEFG